MKENQTTQFSPLPNFYFPQLHDLTLRYFMQCESKARAVVVVLLGLGCPSSRFTTTCFPHCKYPH